jgi:hypothetical protein
VSVKFEACEAITAACVSALRQLHDSCLSGAAREFEPFAIDHLARPAPGDWWTEGAIDPNAARVRIVIHAERVGTRSEFAWCLSRSIAWVLHEGWRHLVPWWVARLEAQLGCSLRGPDGGQLAEFLGALSDDEQQRFAFSAAVNATRQVLAERPGEPGGWRRARKLAISAALDQGLARGVGIEAAGNKLGVPRSTAYRVRKWAAQQRATRREE